MIALNEILKNKELFENKYKLMGKKVDLDKIIKLEQSFIAKDKLANELRSMCNKRCSEIADAVNLNKDIAQEIKEINKLDRKINSLCKASKKAMAKINARLTKLPNLPQEDNLLSLSIKTHSNPQTKTMFLKDLTNNDCFSISNLSEKKYFRSLQKIVFKKEDLPRLIKLKSNSKHNFLWLCTQNSTEIFDNLQNLLVEIAQFLFKKSIKFLKKDCSKELFAWLSDGTRVSVEFLGEYVSRDYSIKFYDKQLDMTKFVQMIRITIF